MKQYLLPSFISLFLALGLVFRLLSRVSTIGGLTIAIVVAVVFLFLAVLVRFVPNSTNGMWLLLFFTQAQIAGNLLMSWDLSNSRLQMGVLLAATCLSWILIFKNKNGKGSPSPDP